MNYKTLGIVLCLTTIATIILNLSIFWISSELSEGNHIAQDYLDAGLSLQPTERIIGFIIAGIPVGLFALSLIKLATYFYNNPVINQLRKTSVYAFWGAIILFLYPTLLSFIFIAD